MHEIFPATEADAEDFASLIAGYPHKSYQQRAQGIDKGALSEFLAAGTAGTLGNKEAGAWIVRDNGEPTAAAIMLPNDWHGRFYGLKMERCATFLSYKEPEATTDMLATAMFERAEALGAEHLSLRIDGADYENLHLLESRGFRLIDCSVKMCAPIKPNVEKIAGINIRQHCAQDRRAILDLSGSQHQHNHFYNDKGLDRKSTDDLFVAWVERCLDGLAAHVFVAEDEDKNILGFVTYLVGRSLNEALGLKLVILDYMVIDGRARGRGLGSALMAQSLAEMSCDYNAVELRTSQNNYPALACYMRYGYRVVSTDFLLHCSDFK